MGQMKIQSRFSVCRSNVFLIMFQIKSEAMCFAGKFWGICLLHTREWKSSNSLKSHHFPSQSQSQSCSSKQPFKFLSKYFPPPIMVPPKKIILIMKCCLDEWKMTKCQMKHMPLSLKESLVHMKVAKNKIFYGFLVFFFHLVGAKCNINDKKNKGFRTRINFDSLLK